VDRPPGSSRSRAQLKKAKGPATSGPTGLPTGSEAVLLEGKKTEPKERKRFFKGWKPSPLHQ